jgi:hypothetical protein
VSACRALGEQSTRRTQGPDRPNLCKKL